MTRTYFITGTDTGAGKTVLTVLLARFLAGSGLRVAALKPVCSGGRGDARDLAAATGGALPLDTINPWHFRAPLAPLLAARREGKRLKLAAVHAHIRDLRRQFDVTLVEGAGGLLSPLGEDFDSRSLLAALRALPLVAAQNRLGVVNHLRLTLAALPPRARGRARIVLMMPPEADVASASNLELLKLFVAAENLFTLPWLGSNFNAATAWQDPRVRRTLRALVRP
jgi:dethiobiotin synthetase